MIVKTQKKPKIPVHDSVETARVDKKIAAHLRSEKLVEQMIQKLRFDRDEIVRSTAAGALGRIKSEKAVEPLIHALKDNHIYVRHVAAWALGEIASEKAINALKQTALTDDDELARGRATEALWKIQRKSKVNVIEFL